MIYTYKCCECGKKIDYTGSILEDKPKTLPCKCGSDMIYDWSQFSKNTISIPERHKA